MVRIGLGNEMSMVDEALDFIDISEAADLSRCHGECVSISGVTRREARRLGLKEVRPFLPPTRNGA